MHPLRLDKGAQQAREDNVQHTFADASPKFTSNQRANLLPYR